MTRCLSRPPYMDGHAYTPVCFSHVFVCVYRCDYVCVDTFQTLQLPETKSSFKLVIWITQIVVLPARESSPPPKKKLESDPEVGHWPIVDESFLGFDHQ